MAPDFQLCCLDWNSIKEAFPALQSPNKEEVKRWTQARSGNLCQGGSLANLMRFAAFEFDLV